MTEDFVAREDIADLAARWTDALNWRHVDVFLRLWADDATWTTSEPYPMQADGSDAIFAKFNELYKNDSAFYQTLHSGVIDLAADRSRALARWSFTELAKPAGSDVGSRRRGIYVDQIVNTERGWLFSRRDCFYVYVERSLRGDWYPLPASEETAAQGTPPVP
jgi:ketosteroid isomerase-like protein